MSITGAAGCRRWRADQGRGRHQRRRVGDVRGGRDPGRARRPGARRTGRPPVAASGSTCRCSGRPWRSWSTRPRTPSSAVSRRAGSATPTRTSCRTRPSRRPTARSRSRPGPSASGRGSAPRSVCPALADDARFTTNGDRVERPSGAAPDPGRAVHRADDGRLAGRPRRGRDPGRADQRCRGRLRVTGGRRARDDRRAGAPGLGRDPPGRHPVHAGRDAGRRSGRRRPPSARTPTRSSPSSATARGGRRVARRRGRLRSPEPRALRAPGGGTTRRRDRRPRRSGRPSR